MPGYANSQPSKLGGIGNVRIGHAARAFCEDQRVINQRRVSGDHQSRTSDLYPITVDNDTMTPLTEYDTDWPGGRQIRLPTIFFSGRKGFSFHWLAADKL